MVFQTPPSLVVYEGKRFLISDAPSDSNLHEYLKIFKQNGVTDVVRVCEPTYNAEVVTRAGIQVHDWCFADGDAPPAAVVNNWLALVNSSISKNKNGCIAIHCVAGLGRAPVLVAVAMIEDGCRSEDAIQYIRKHRRGAINSKQIKFLEKYKPHRKIKSAAGCCVVM